MSKFKTQLSQQNEKRENVNTRQNSLSASSSSSLNTSSGSNSILRKPKELVKRARKTQRRERERWVFGTYMGIWGNLLQRTREDSSVSPALFKNRGFLNLCVQKAISVSSAFCLPFLFTFFYKSTHFSAKKFINFL